MIISDSKKFIFIHIYKTAGTSISDLLLPYSRFSQKLCYYYTPTKALINFSRIIFDNANIQKYITGYNKHVRIESVLSNEPNLNNYFKFCFVRNPYLWLISHYNYVKRNSRHFNHNSFNKMNFLDFLEFEINNNSPRQFDFCTDTENKFMIDFVGKLENIDKDISYLQEKLKLQSIGIRHLNKNKTSSETLFEKYYDDKSVKLVNEYFSIDFETFGYDKI